MFAATEPVPIKAATMACQRKASIARYCTTVTAHTGINIMLVIHSLFGGDQFEQVVCMLTYSLYNM